MEKRKNKSWILFIPLGIFVLITILLSFKVVPTGYTGVKTTFGQISDTPIQPGITLKVPFVQEITLVNNKLQDAVISSKIWGESSEKTPVYADDIVISYRIMSGKSTWLIANITDPGDLMAVPIVSSAIKNAMVKLNADEVTLRSKIEPLVLESLRESIVEKYGEGLVEVTKVSINQMDFEESYNEAIAQKSIARQNQERQAIENKTAIDKAAADKQVAITNAEAEAERKKIEAEGEANALKIKADAEAEANRKVSESLTNEILRQKYIEKWDGVLPEFLGSEDSGILIDLTKNKTTD